MGINPHLLIIGSGVQLNETYLRSSRHVQADVVLLDKTHGDYAPMLYQMTGFSDVADSLGGAVDVGLDSFVMIGQVLKILKAEKQILLSNTDPDSEGDLVSYKHLIIVGGDGHTLIGRDDEFRGGILGLHEAIRLQQALDSRIREQFPDSQLKSRLARAEGCRGSFSVLEGVLPSSCHTTREVARRVKVPTSDLVLSSASSPCSRLSYEFQL